MWAQFRAIETTHVNQGEPEAANEEHWYDFAFHDESLPGNQGKRLACEVL